MKVRGATALLAVACAVAAVNGASFGMVLPVLPEILPTMGAGDTGHAAWIGGLLVAAFAVVQLTTAPVLGALVDAFGRRPVLLFALACGALSHLAFAMGNSFAWLLAARALTGLAGAAHIAVTAMIADCTDPSARPTVFAKLAAADGVGMIAGPALAGLLAEQNPRAPFYLAFVLDSILLAVVLALLAETLPRDLRQKFSWKQAMPTASLKLLMASPKRRRLVLTLSLASLGFGSLPVTWAYFVDLRFDWGARDVGLTLAILGASSIAANIFLLPILRRRLTDIAILVMTLFIGGSLMVILAGSFYEIYLYVLISAEN